MHIFRAAIHFGAAAPRFKPAGRPLPAQRTALLCGIHFTIFLAKSQRNPGIFCRNRAKGVPCKKSSSACAKMGQDFYDNMVRPKVNIPAKSVTFIDTDFRVDKGDGFFHIHIAPLMLPLRQEICSNWDTLCGEEFYRNSHAKVVQREKFEPSVP